jgi:hypothetical protein
MDFKRLITHFTYRIEPKPEGGFIARCKDPNLPPIVGATREEVDQKIQANISADLAAQFPGLKLPLDNANKEVKLSYHVEAKPAAATSFTTATRRMSRSKVRRGKKSKAPSSQS